MRWLFESWLELEETKESLAKWRIHIEDIRRIYKLKTDYAQLEKEYKETYERIEIMQKIIESTIVEIWQKGDKQNE